MSEEFYTSYDIKLRKELQELNKNNLSPTVGTTFEFFMQGKNQVEIAAIRKLTIDTIYRHINECRSILRVQKNSKSDLLKQNIKTLNYEEENKIFNNDRENERLRFIALKIENERIKTENEKIKLENERVQLEKEKLEKETNEKLKIQQNNFGEEKTKIENENKLKMEEEKLRIEKEVKEKIKGKPCDCIFAKTNPHWKNNCTLNKMGKLFK